MAGVGRGGGAGSFPRVEIRQARPEEFAAAGDLVVDAYQAIEPFGLGDYADELRDVGARAVDADVLVALDDDGSVLGAVTYVPGPGSSVAEFTEADAAGIRMLAVSLKGQGRGVGRALVEACVDRARGAGKTQIVLHTTDWMTTAHRLYERLGFRRDESIDWQPEPHEMENGEFWLRGYRFTFVGDGGGEVR
jgi:GNAT superfamily N-acetyltransferase